MAGRMHRVVIFCSLALLALLVAASLIPAKWQYLRTGLGWQSDHFLGFFVATSVVCFAWSRPLLVGPILMATACPTLKLHCTAPAGHWSLLCLPRSSSTYGSGVPAAHRTPNSLKAWWDLALRLAKNSTVPLYFI